MRNSNFKLPKSYKAAVLTAAGRELDIVEKPIDDLQKGEVWVQIKASPINPSDLAMLAGTYPHKKTYPFVPGLEASGVVMASGGGIMANFLLGKNVACSAPDTGDGTWAEFIKVSANKCVNLSAKLNFVEGASALVNPLTALVLLKKVDGKSFVNTAAAGALGKMIIKLAAKENVTSINLVRSKDQAKMLKQMGAMVVLDASSPDFDEAFKVTCAHYEATTILDAVGGNLTNRLLLGAPNNTKLIAYASLSRENISVAPQSIIRQGKTIEGFHLGSWLEEQSLMTKILLIRKAQKLIADGTLATTVHKQYQLAGINQAIAEYQKNMSLGKWMLVN
jgi:NADPH:quinone reductase-like Zn-dependent oxidoreductase